MPLASALRKGGSTTVLLLFSIQKSPGVPGLRRDCAGIALEAGLLLAANSVSHGKRDRRHGAHASAQRCLLPRKHEKSV
jgi:hypothetical protein